MHRIPDDYCVEGHAYRSRKTVLPKLSRNVRGGQSPCTPAEREAVALLLTGKSEKEIADALGISLHTTHARITTIYRKFDVGSRAELMALWL